MGYAEIAQYKKDALAVGASVLLLDAGDVWQGTLISAASEGRATVTWP